MEAISTDDQDVPGEATGELIEIANLNAINRISSKDKFKIDGREFVNASVLGGTKRGNISCWIWDRGIKIVEIKNGKQFWKCAICKKAVIYNRSSTDHPMTHLTRTHRLTKDGPIKTNSIESAFQRIPSSITSLVTRTGQEAFCKALLEWIVDMHIPFSVVENKKFQVLVSTAISAASRLLPKDGNTIRNWILQEFTLRPPCLIRNSTAS